MEDQRESARSGAADAGNAKRAEEPREGHGYAGTLFEEFGFNYIGPIDGHNLDVLLSTLSNLKKTRGTQFLHIVTRKGKGYEPAEKTRFCTTGNQVRPDAGITPKSGGKPTYTQIFGDWLCDTAALDSRLIGNNSGDARRFWVGAFLPGVSRTGIRRRYRRAAAPHFCRRIGLQRV